MRSKNLTHHLLTTKDPKSLTQLIEKNFNQMNHNTFWGTLKKEAQKRGLNEKVSQIAKLHVDPNSKKRLFTNRSDIVHLINHGTFSNDKLNKSGMFLKESGKDVFINIDELFSHKLNAKFIFMSGCSTGEVHTLKGEEPLGIISYLHSNGTESAILSSWRISSEIETTVDVVRDFYRYWVEEGLSKNIALQRAMVDNKKINPYEYGGFVLFGGG